MRRLLVAALAAPLLLAAAPPPGMDGAGNRIARFDPVPTREGDATERGAALHCTFERRWCAELRREGEGGFWTLGVTEHADAESLPSTALVVTMAAPERGEAGFAIWPHIVREAGGAVLIGVERTRSIGYASGGGRVRWLELFSVAPGAATATGVLEVPTEGLKNLRACFSGARSVRNRAGFCRDEYDFEGVLTLDPATRRGPSRFRFGTRASTFPGGRSMTEDSTTAPRLWGNDLHWTGDRTCSYRRTFAFDAAAGRYLPDRPLPDCPDYLELP